jgi:serine O-acetyltransferase
MGTFIDHGMGVVIGETAIVGEYVLIYQGVTLGGTGKQSGKRHPTLGDSVVIGAGAKVLGNIEIGSNCRIGAGSVVLKAVPPDCTVVGIPGRIVHRHGVKVSALDHSQTPDPEGDVIRSLIGRVEQLEKASESHALHPTNGYLIDPELLKNVRPRHLTPSDNFEPKEYDGFSEGGGI